MKGLPDRAYVVVSKPDPVFASAGTDWEAIKPRSIHLDHHEALHHARELRREVFRRLAAPGDANNSEEFITRMLAYRQTIKITICRLDKIATALVA